MRKASGDLNLSLMLKIAAGILAAGIWLGNLQMQVNTLQKDHDLHWGKDDK